MSESPPPETLMSTLDPSSTDSPASGDVETTVPPVAELPLELVILPTFSPALSSFLFAWSRLIPVTSGTVISELPDEKWTVIFSPLLTVDPGEGDELTNWPALTVSEAWSLPLTKTSPSSSSAFLACFSVMPVSLGTVTLSVLSADAVFVGFGSGLSPENSA